MRRRRELYSRFGMVLARSEPTPIGHAVPSAPVTTPEATAAASPISRTHLHISSKAVSCKASVGAADADRGFSAAACLLPSRVRMCSIGVHTAGADL